MPEKKKMCGVFKYVMDQTDVFILQARSKLSQIQDSQHEISKSIEQYSSTLNGTHGGSMTNLADMSEGFPEKENGGFGAVVRRFRLYFKLLFCS